MDIDEIKARCKKPYNWTGLSAEELVLAEKITATEAAESLVKQWIEEPESPEDNLLRYKAKATIVQAITAHLGQLGEEQTTQIEPPLSGQSQNQSL